jgi:hypothetical protein
MRRLKFGRRLFITLTMIRPAGLAVSLQSKGFNRKSLRFVTLSLSKGRTAAATFSEASHGVTDRSRPGERA